MQTNMSENRMFYLLASMAPKTSLCLQAEARTDKESHLWHQRFGHLNYQGLSTLASTNMVDGMPLLNIPEKLCEACMVGKQHVQSILKQSSWRASKPLQSVHLDLCGPIKPASNSNKRYFISFIDDFSQKTWIYFLNENSYAFNVFKNFKAADNIVHSTTKWSRRAKKQNNHEHYTFNVN